MKPFVLAAALSAALSPAVIAPVALAQDAVPLTYDLFEMTWVVTQFDGGQDLAAEAPALISFTDDMASGTLFCGGDWNAEASLASLPAYEMKNVWAAPGRPACAATADEEALIAAFKRVVRVDTTPEGLGFFDAEGKRVVLANAGG